MRIAKRVLVGLIFLIGSTATQLVAGEPTPWEPVGVALVVEGRSLIELRAVDDSREKTLDTLYLVVDSESQSGASVTFYQPGENEHEAHAQIKFSLVEGDELFLDLFSRRLRSGSRPSSQDKAPREPVGALKVVVQAGELAVTFSE